MLAVALVDTASARLFAASYWPVHAHGITSSTQHQTAHTCVVAAGPPESLDELQTMFAVARQQWPGATVKASSLDAFLGHLSNAVDAGRLKLPVVTGMCAADAQFMS
jgi:hypothetical protein